MKPGPVCCEGSRKLREQSQTSSCLAAIDELDTRGFLSALAGSKRSLPPKEADEWEDGPLIEETPPSSAAEIGDLGGYQLKRLCPRRMGIPQVARWLSGWLSPATQPQRERLDLTLRARS